MVGSLQISQGLQRALGTPPKQSPILLQFLLQCVFGQPGKEKWWMWFRCLLTNVLKCRRIWGLIYTQMRGYCPFQKWALRPRGGGAHEGILVGWGISISENGLLLPQGQSKPQRCVAGWTQRCSWYCRWRQDAGRKWDLLPSVGGWLVWSVLKDWPLESAKCVLWNRLKCRNEHGGCHLESDGCTKICRAKTGVSLLSEHYVN